MLPVRHRLCQIRAPRGYTLGPHQKLLACSKIIFCGAFSKPFYCGGEGVQISICCPQSHKFADIQETPQLQACGYAGPGKEAYVGDVPIAGEACFKVISKAMNNPARAHFRGLINGKLIDLDRLCVPTT
jgi:hypothetical protein